MLLEEGIMARKYFYPLTNSFECYRNYPTAGAEKTPYQKTNSPELDRKYDPHFLNLSQHKAVMSIF